MNVPFSLVIYVYNKLNESHQVLLSKESYLDSCDSCSTITGDSGGCKNISTTFKRTLSAIQQYSWPHYGLLN